MSKWRYKWPEHFKIVLRFTPQGKHFVVIRKSDNKKVGEASRRCIASSLAANAYRRDVLSS